MDTGTGKVEYLIMSRKDTNRLVALPWIALQARQTKDEAGKEQRQLIIDTNKYALRPDMSINEKTAQDLSPSIEHIVKQMENLRSGEAPPAPVSRELQEQVQPGMMTNEPEDLKIRSQAGLNSGGQVIPPDEGEQSGKPGTIFGGPATLPPPEASAPGYEGADKQAEQRRQPSSK